MIVIHIGMPKAGSTTIQHFMRDNAEALRYHSVDYANIGRENPNHNLNHRNFANELLERPKRIHAKSGLLADLVKHIKETSYKTTIISSEEFSRCLNDSIEKLRDMLSDLRQEFRIILVIRDMLDLIPSAYAQSVRYGASTDDFDTFFQIRTNNDTLDQYKIAERWANYFGWGSVYVRVLSPSALRGGDLIEDFMASAGLDADAPYLVSLPRPPRANESAGWKTLEAGRAFFAGRSSLDAGHPLLKAVSPDKPKTRKNFGYAAEATGIEFGWNKDRGRYLDRAQAISCWETYSSWVRLLNQHLVEKLPPPQALTERNFVEREFLPDVTHIDAAELKAFYDAWGARLEDHRKARRLRKKLNETR